MWNCPAQGWGINCTSLPGFVAVLSFVFSVGFKFWQRLQDLRNGGSIGCHRSIRCLHHPCQCSQYLGGNVFSPRQRKSWVSFVQLPLLFHAFSRPPQSCLHISWWLEPVPGSERWLNICFDLSPYYWAALIIPLGLNTFCSACLQGTLEILLSSASSSLMCWSNQMKFSW